LSGAEGEERSGETPAKKIMKSMCLIDVEISD